MPESRKIERFDLALPARIDVLPLGSRSIDLMTANICDGGAFFPTRNPLEEGVEVVVDLTLNLENVEGISAKVKIAGRVLRSQPDGMAIRFEGRYRMRAASPQQASACGMSAADAR